MPEIEATGERLVAAREMIARRIIGQEDVVEQTLIAILCGGHGLLVGAPGLAKTRLVETLGTVLGLVANRVQFTPDLMPADILGAEVLETGADGTPRLPLHRRADLLPAPDGRRDQPRLARAPSRRSCRRCRRRRSRSPASAASCRGPSTSSPPRTRSSRRAPIRCPRPSSTASCCRSTSTIPTRDAERAIILATTGIDEAVAEPVFDSESLMAAQRLIRRLPVGEQVVERILDLVRSARPGTPEAHPAVRDAVSWGPGPRAAQALMLAIRARALIQGRLVPNLDDVAALAQPVLIHRMALGFAARAEGQTLTELIDRLVADQLGPGGCGVIEPRRPRGRDKPQGPVGLQARRREGRRRAAAAARRGRAARGHRSRWASTAGGARGRARTSGSTARRCPATRARRSTGGARASPTSSSSARWSGRRRRRSRSGSTTPSRWTTATPSISGRDRRTSAPRCWRWRCRCC